jgi:tRNA A37 methylthiotransferase MiaB
VGVFGYSPETKGSEWHYPEAWDWDAVRELELELESKLEEQKTAKMEQLVGTIHRGMIVDYSPEMEALCARLWFQAPEIDGIVYLENRPVDDKLMVDIEITDALGDELWGIVTEED